MKSRQTADPSRKGGGIRPGLVAKNFRRIAQNGFGDPYNGYPHCMAWFGDCLYVGTTRGTLAHRGRWRAETNPDWLGPIWPVKIPRDTFDIDLRAEIWRYAPSEDRWCRVYISPMVQGVDGFEVPLCVCFRAMAVFQGLSDSAPALYVPTMASHQTGYAVMLRSTDGMHFETVSEPGLNIPDPYKPKGIRSLFPFQGRLFTSSAVGQKRRESNTAGFMVIVVSDDPVRGKWELACEPHFGDPNNLTVFDIAEFNGCLYAGTMNVNHGFQIWKTDAAGQPPYKWRKVIDQGAYRGRLNQIAMTLQPFGEHLYAGSAVQEGGFDRSNGVGPAAVELIRLHPDDRWDLVVGDPRLTPDGFKVPLSGLGAGFDKPFAGYLWSMCAHEGWLYAGTFDSLSGLKYSNLDRLPSHLRAYLNPKKIGQVINKLGGFDLWRSRNGHQWAPVTQNGFGNYYNNGVRTMTSTPYGLFVGATNPFGPDVAMKRAAGWNYEHNPRGGLEIWLGSPVQESDQASSSGESIIGINRSDLRTEKTTGSDEEKLEKIIDQFYGGSGFRHFGYWTSDINDAKTACENLVAEILAFIPEKHGTIIDIGCGSGATTQYLSRHFPPGTVTGVATSRRALAICQEKSSQIKFLYRKLPKTSLPEESFDCVVWMKGHEHLGDRRKLLRECFRLLKPGGQMVCFDTIAACPTKRNIWERILPSADSFSSIDEYGNFLLAAGFLRVELIDVTSETLGEFKNYLADYSGLMRLSGELTDGMMQKIESNLFEDKAVQQCLLVSGYKPGKK